MSDLKIVVASGLTIKGLPEKIAHKIKTELTVSNPVYVSAKKRGSAHLMRITEPYLYFFNEPNEKILLTPTGYLDRLYEHVKDLNYEIIDRTVKPEMSRKIKFTGETRDYQEAAIQDVLDRRYGVLQAATGAGKTFTGVAIAAERGVKTLVAVHNKELVDQWVSSFKRFTDISSIGIIGGGKVNIQDVTIGVINTLAKVAPDIKDKFGMLIIDECHRSLSQSWITLINNLKPYYQLGLTATPFRNDGTTKALWAVIGPKLHEVDKKKLEEAKAILIPEVYRMPTSFRYDYDDDYAHMLSALATDRKRNYLIANHVTLDILKHGESILVVSDRVDHCDELAAIIAEQCPSAKPIVISSKMPRDAREAAVQGVRAGVYNVMLSTIALVGEGFDAPNLAALFLTTPVRFKGRLIQTVGRILRPTKSESVPRVYDYRDNFIKVLQNSGFARDREYVSNRWDICQ